MQAGQQGLQSDTLDEIVTPLCPWRLQILAFASSGPMAETKSRVGTVGCGRQAIAAGAQKTGSYEAVWLQPTPDNSSSSSGVPEVEKPLGRGPDRLEFTPVGPSLLGGAALRGCHARQAND